MSGVSMRMCKLAVIAGVVAGAVGVVVPAIAQTPVGPTAEGYFDRNRNVSVTQRASNPGGIPAGSFRLYPQLSASAGYTDNVFASAVNEVSSATARADASFDLSSNWSRHALTFFGAVGASHYFEEDSADTYTTEVGADVRLDVARSTVLDGGASLFQGKEELTENPAAGLIEPVEYDEIAANIGFQQVFNRFRLGGRLSTSEFDFTDSVLFNGRNQDQDFRDHDSLTGQIRGDFALSYDTSLFAQFTTSSVEYDAPGFLQPSRDAEDTEYLAGADFDLSNLTRGQVGIGYFKREFDSPLINDVDGLAVNAGVDWFVTPLITASFNARRGITESALLTAPSAVETAVSAGFAYEFRRNLSLSGELAYSDLSFKGTDRGDESWQLSTGAAYGINRWSDLTFNLTYQTRSSSGTAAGDDYDRVTALIGVRLYR